MKKVFRKNFILIIIFLILLFSSLFTINKFLGSDFIFKKLPIKSQILLRNISSNKKSGNSFFHLFNNLFNDYNAKFLPETQFIDLDFKTLKVEFDQTYKENYLKKTDYSKNFFYSFYIEIINDDLLLTDFNGNIYQNGSLFSGGGGGSSTFVNLTDTPSSFTASKFLAVNSGGSAIEFVNAPSSSGTQIDETTDVSLNNIKVHGDLSANDASFNIIDTTSIRINGVDLISGAPAALDTLNELAAALDNSANFATNVTNTLGSLQTQINTKQATITFNAPSSNNTNPSTSAQIKTALDAKQDTITFNAPSSNNSNPSTSAQIKTALDAKQDTLTAGTNITINGNTISASGGGGGSSLWTTSSSNSSDIYYNSGKVGIATTSPSYTLDVGYNGSNYGFRVAGSSRTIMIHNDEINSSSDLYLNYNGGSVYYSGSNPVTSDNRMKHNETEIINALDTINKLKIYKYFKNNYKKLYDANHHFTIDASGNPITQDKYCIETGVISQDILNIPELKYTVKEGAPADASENHYSVLYNDIFVYNLKATQELHQLFESQKQEIQSQQQEIETLKLFNIDSNNQINELKQENQQLKQEIQTIQQHLGL